MSAKRIEPDDPLAFALSDAIVELADKAAEDTLGAVLGITIAHLVALECQKGYTQEQVFYRIHRCLAALTALECAGGEKVAHEVLQ